MKYFAGGTLMGVLALLGIQHAAALGLFGSEEANMAKLPEPTGNQQVATFAGGCFWCMEHPFDDLDGVVATTSGYTGGHVENPTYEQVVKGDTGHAEAVQVLYDPDRVSYEQLLEVFWRQINPTQKNRQFCDVGPQYRTAIFYHDAEQRRLAEASRERMDKEGPFEAPIVTEIEPAGPFYPAEEYHQDYYRKNPVRYSFYRSNCGRDQYLQQVWGNEGD
jgi:peptide-methionine (S)-S-oxide reductase